MAKDIFHDSVRNGLEEQQPDRVLYLAVPLGAYKTFFNLPFVETVIERFQLSLLVYEPKDEVILEWKR